MRDDRQEHAAPRADSTGDWSMNTAREPRLAELMEDPMMGLIWRRDGLDPPHARQTVIALQAIVRAGREAQAPG